VQTVGVFLSNKKIIAIFALINVLIFVIAGVLWLFPIAGSLRSVTAGVRQMDRRYSAERIFFAEYEENKRELEEIRTSFLMYNEKLPVLVKISHMGERHRLGNSQFESVNMSVGHADEGRMYETRVNTEYSGAFEDIISFLHEFSESDGKIRSFSVFANENAVIRLRFSLFGGE